MTKQIVRQSVAINLANLGDFVDVDISQVDKITMRGINAGRWGAGVVEALRLIGNSEVSFSSAVTLTTAAPTEEPFDVTGVNGLRIRATTAGSGYALIAVDGKEAS